MPSDGQMPCKTTGHLTGYVCWKERRGRSHHELEPLDLPQGAAWASHNALFSQEPERQLARPPPCPRAVAQIHHGRQVRPANWQAGPRQRQQFDRAAWLARRPRGRCRGGGSGRGRRLRHPPGGGVRFRDRAWGAYGNKPSDEKTSPYDPARAPSQQFGNPVHCIRIDKDGFVYVCDRINNRLQIFRKDGSFVVEQVYEKATRGTGSVYDLVFSPDKEQNFIYMIDGMNGEVRIVDRSSKETLGRFGRPGRQVGMFTALHNIAVDRQGNIFTSEVNTGQRVQKFRRIDMQE